MNYNDTRLGSSPDLRNFSFLAESGVTLDSANLASANLANSEFGTLQTGTRLSLTSNSPR